MTHLPPGEPPDQPPEQPPDPEGRLRITPPGVLVGCAVLGLVLGWLLRRGSGWLSRTPPTVGWLPMVSLAFVAAVIGTLAWTTHRQLHRQRIPMAAHTAVNRLVLGKAGALVGALVAGGYLGFALSFVGVLDALARQQIVRAAATGVVGILVTVASLLLERACRVREPDR